jgi:hypothetical protein
MKFPQLYNGESELWDLLRVLVDKEPGQITNRILYIGDMGSAFNSKAQELETTTTLAMLGTTLSKKEDRLMEAAKIYLKLGDFKQYCNILIELRTTNAK